MILPFGGGGNTLTIQTYQGTPASSGNNVLVAAAAGQSVYVLSYAMQATGTVACGLRDSGSGTQRVPQWSFQAREGISRPAIPGGYLFATDAGKGLDANLNAAVGVNLEIQYVVF